MARSLIDNLKLLGGIAVGGWGPEVAMGVIEGFLKKLSYARCYEYILHNKDLTLPEEQIQRYRGMIKKIPLQNITTEDVLNTLKEKRPDLSDLIINHPQGMVWLERQVENIRTYFLK
jgi:hypothetical protein